MVQTADLEISGNKSLNTEIENWLFPQIAWFICWTRSSIDTYFLPWPPASMNTCTSCFKVPAPLPHFAITHQSFTIHIIHSLMNVGCITSLCMKKLNYSTYFIFDGRLCCFRHADMLTERLELMMQHGMIDRLTRDTAKHICTKHHLSFDVKHLYAWVT